MSDIEQRILQKAVEEAREEQPTKEPDWSAIDAKLFARIEADRSERAHEGRGRAWSVAAFGLAAAAAFAVFVGRPSTLTEPLAQMGSRASAPNNASALVLHKGPGEVSVRAKTGSGSGEASVLSSGQSVRAGDVVDTTRATAFFERARAVTWALEESSQITVQKAGASLVLALDRGAVEAQVTPVPVGEAFAIDVMSNVGSVTRIAVHGTHLRVARVGDTQVVVDLTEGVVSIGTPPRAGSTNGTLVTAPAHVEFDVTHPSDTLHVSHAANVVRPAVDLAEMMARLNALAAAAVPPIVAANEPLSPPSRPVGRVLPPLAVPPSKEPEPPPALPPADPRAEETITSAVRACLAARLHASDLKVTVTSHLELRLNAEGTVEFARFDPPLAPEVQTCASAAVYKTRFTRSGSVIIPIELD